MSQYLSSAEEITAEERIARSRSLSITFVSFYLLHNLEPNQKEDFANQFILDLEIAKIFQKSRNQNQRNSGKKSGSWFAASQFSNVNRGQF
jgi:hypothetical protein